MKIISKYKDFYDSFGFITGKPDESVTYLRTTVCVNQHSDPEYRDIITELSRYTYSETGVYDKDKKEYSAYLNTVVVGIYPYIYLSPFYIILRNKINGIKSDDVITDIKPITISEYDLKHNREHIYEKVITKFMEYKNVNSIHGNLYVHKISDKSYRWNYYNKYDIKNNPWKIENTEIFHRLNAPTFVYTDIRDSISSFMPNGHGIIINPVFTKLPFNVLGAEREKIISEQNIYIDIENFLWATKQEPESIPDNNTKILAAGFDLKTSFRNVK